MTFKLLTLNALTTLFILLSNVQSQERLFIPTEFVENIIHSDTASNKHALIKACYETFGIVPEDEEPEQDHFILLKHKEVDLDSDTISEVLVLFGWVYGNTALCVLKQIDGAWFLIFVTPVWVHNEESEMYIADNYGANRVFYVRMIYERGSGIKKQGYEFFKLIDNEVFPCCKIITQARIFGWSLYLNQKMEAHFSISKDSTDAIKVQYTYEFFAGPIYDSNMSWESNKDIMFVEGQDSVDFIWNPTNYSYRPKFAGNNNSLNEQKLMSVSDYGNDTLFVRAFQWEIQQQLQNSDVETKRVLQTYLDLVKANGEAYTPGGPLRKTNQINNTGFWGPKKDSN